MQAAGVAGNVYEEVLRSTGAGADYAAERIKVLQGGVLGLLEAKVQGALAGAAALGGEALDVLKGELGKVVKLADDIAGKVWDKMTAPRPPSAVGEPEAAAPTGVQPWDDDELELLRGHLSEREAIETRHRIRIAHLVDDLNAGQIDGDKMRIEVAKAHAELDGELAAMRERDWQAVTDAGLELERERLERQRIAGELTEAEYQEAQIALDLRSGLIDFQLAEERRLTVGVQAELEERRASLELEAEIMQQVRDSLTGTWSTLQETLQAAGTDDTIDQQFKARAEMVERIGLGAVSTISASLKGSREQAGAALAGMMSDLGSFGASFADDAKRQAAILSAFSLGAAAISAASGNWAKAGAYGLAAAKFALIGAFGTGGRRSSGAVSKGNAPSVSSSASAAASPIGGSGGLHVNVTIQSGQTFSTAEEIQGAVYDAITAGVHLGKRIPPQAVGY